MRDMDEGALHREERKYLSNKELKIKLKWGPETKMNWPTDRRVLYNLKFNLRHCTANYRPVLSSERAPYMKKKDSN
jgi:transposase